MKCQFNVFIFQFHRMSVKISKIPFNFFFFLRKIKKNCKDLGVGQDLTEFVKISMLEFLKIYIYI
jgi:hypothetical protein